MAFWWTWKRKTQAKLRANYQTHRLFRLKLKFKPLLNVNNKTMSWIEYQKKNREVSQNSMIQWLQYLFGDESSADMVITSLI